MFKQRLRKWGCRKNISLKREDEETLRQLFQQGGGPSGHQAHPDSLSPPHHPHRHPRPTHARDIQLANGQITTVDRLATHLRRKSDYYGRRQSSALVTSPSSSSPSTKTQSPPPPPPPPQQKLPNPSPTTLLTKTISDPQTFRVSESVLFQTRTFIISRFRDADQRPQPLAADGPKLVVQWRAYSEWLAYCNRIGIALRGHRLDEALREMRVGPQGITGILRAISGENQIPNVLGMLFYFLITVTSRQTNLAEDEKRQLFVVVRALVKYAAQACAQEGLPEIIVRLLQSIWFVDDDDMLFDLSNKAWQMTCQTWGSSGPGVPGPGAGGAGAGWHSPPQEQQQKLPSPSTADHIAATWANIFTTNPSSAGPELLPRTDLVIASATSQLSRRTYAELLILHSSYLHSAIAAQSRNPSLDDRLVSIFQFVAGISTDPSHLTSMYTQLLLAYHYRGDWDAVRRTKPPLWWALRNAPNEYLKVWAVITVKGHVGRLTEAGETEKASRMAGWLAEMESMQWNEEAMDNNHNNSTTQKQQQQQQQQVLLMTPPPDCPDEGDQREESPRQALKDPSKC